MQTSNIINYRRYVKTKLWKTPSIFRIVIQTNRNRVQNRDWIQKYAANRRLQILHQRISTNNYHIVDMVKEHPQLRTVSIETAKNYAASIGAQYAETSARTGEGIDG